MRVKLSLRPPTDREELQAFVLAFFGVTIPSVSVCPGHSAPLDAFAAAYFATAPITVWHASRGFAGKTTLLSLLALTELVTLGASITLLGGSGVQSRRVIEEMANGWAFPNAPRRLLLTEPTASRTRTRNGGRAIALTASQRSVRGPHPQRLRCDEVDEMALPLLHAALGQTLPARGIRPQTVLASTHQYPDGTFSWCLAEASRRGWPVYRWCYHETSHPWDGWLAPDVIAAKRSEMPALMWDVEVELGEPSSEGRAFLPAALDQCFPAAQAAPAIPPGVYHEFEGPRPGGTYVHGADWAKESDWTVIVTFAVEDGRLRLVAYERLQRQPWPAMAERLDARIDRYGGVACHDATGIGNVVADLLRHPVRPVVLTGRVRDECFRAYVSAVEQHRVSGPRVDPLYSAHKYCRSGDLFSTGAKFHPPDDVVACAAAYRAFRDELGLPHSPAAGNLGEPYRPGELLDPY